jgi:hypothetical protein
MSVGSKDPFDVPDRDGSDDDEAADTITPLAAVVPALDATAAATGRVDVGVVGVAIVGDGHNSSIQSQM